MLTAKEARTIASNVDIQEQVNIVDKVVKFMEKINKEIIKASDNGLYECSVNCIDTYVVRSSKVFGYYYNNVVLLEVKKRLITNGYNIKIQRKREKDELDYSYKNIIISWD